MVRNSGTQQAIVIKLEISSKYIIQYILGENPGNPILLIISEQEVTGSDIRRKMVYSCAWERGYGFVVTVLYMYMFVECGIFTTCACL